MKITMESGADGNFSDGGRGRKVCARELATLLAIDPVTVWRWQAEGVPFERRSATGAEHSFWTAEVLRWLVARELKAAAPETAKDRLARVQADQIELDIAERGDRLINPYEAERKVACLIAATRTELLQLPERLAAALAGPMSFEERRDLMRAEITRALIEVSRLPARLEAAGGTYE
jgi:phage terminase Nu1 subunit (DNA packaging protein)